MVCDLLDCDLDWCLGCNLLEYLEADLGLLYDLFLEDVLDLLLGLEEFLIIIIMVAGFRSFLVCLIGDLVLGLLSWLLLHLDTTIKYKSFSHIAPMYIYLNHISLLNW